MNLDRIGEVLDDYKNGLLDSREEALEFIVEAINQTAGGEPHPETSSPAIRHAHSVGTQLPPRD